MSDEIGVEIVRRVAAAENTEPVELTPPLGEVVDVDALAAFLETADAGTSVEFIYRDWTIEARSDRTIKLRHSVDTR